MSGLSDRKIQIVRTLMSTSPDSVVRGLHSALAGNLDVAFSEVRGLIAFEMIDRRFRDIVFSPLSRMFADPGLVKDRLIFPKSVLPLLWTALKEDAPDQISMVKGLLEGGSVESRSGPLNGLLRRICDGLQGEKSEAYKAAASRLSAHGPDLLGAFCACLKLAPVVREASYRLTDWVDRPDDARAAALRVTYRDAIAISEDNGPLLFEMLAAGMDEPWQIIRLISLVMDRPTQAYFAGSELSSFPIRVMDLVDINLTEIGRFDHTKTPDEARTVAALIHLTARQISELESGIEFTRDSGWGARVQKQKQTLANTVESRLRKIEPMIGTALPYHVVRGEHSSRKVPRMTKSPTGQDINNLKTLMTFIEAIRPSASLGGFASARTRILEAAAETLDRYAEDGFALIRDREVEDFDLALEHLTHAADFLSLMGNSVSADLMRRRIDAALDNHRRDLAKYG